MAITQIETTKFGTISTKDALAKLANGESLNVGFSQVVLGVYENGTSRTSLKARCDGFYFMSGNFCAEAQ